MKTVSMNVLLLFLGFCMKMEPVCSFENLASICQITWRHNPDDNIFKIVVGIFKISSNFRATVREKVNKDRKYTYKVALKRFQVFTSFCLIQWGPQFLLWFRVYINCYVTLYYIILYYIILYYIILYYIILYYIILYYIILYFLEKLL